MIFKKFFFFNKARDKSHRKMNLSCYSSFEVFSFFFFYLIYARALTHTHVSFDVNKNSYTKEFVVVNPLYIVNSIIWYIIYNNYKYAIVFVNEIRCIFCHYIEWKIRIIIYIIFIFSIKYYFRIIFILSVINKSYIRKIIMNRYTSWLNLKSKYIVIYTLI